MKFEDKYELFDAVTEGRVESFIGRDLGTGARVLVHIFDAPPKKPEQPTVHWVLESFRAVAPEPPGLVVSTGRYSGTTYAYLVTQVPDDPALQQWKQSYELSVAETREIIAVPEGNAAEDPANEGRRRVAALSQAGVSAAMPFPEPVTVPGDKPAEPPAEPVEGIRFGSRAEVRSEPSEFTRQFFAGSDEPIQKAPTPATAKPAEVGADSSREDLATRSGPGPYELPPPPGGGSPLKPSGGASPDVAGFTAIFQSSPRPETVEPAESVESFRKSDGKGGDFTKFFRGPFDGDRPAATPNIPLDFASTPQRNAPGEFTRVFGPGKDNPFEPPSTSAATVKDDPRKGEPGSFTQRFPEPRQSSPSSPGPMPSLPVPETKAPPSPTPATFDEPRWTQPVSPPPEIPAVPPDPPIVPTQNAGTRGARPSVQSGATQVFSVPSRDVPHAPPPPTGPSEYTRIISGGLAGLRAAEEKPAADAQSTHGELPAFKAAPAVPPPPKVAPPPAPKAPPAGALAAKAKPSYLPMIIILNVSLIIAVLLIVYFAIKH